LPPAEIDWASEAVVVLRRVLIAVTVVGCGTSLTSKSTVEGEVIKTVEVEAASCTVTVEGAGVTKTVLMLGAQVYAASLL
jgi:hypothetical protein